MPINPNGSRLFRIYIIAMKIGNSHFEKQQYFEYCRNNQQVSAVSRTYIRKD